MVNGLSGERMLIGLAIGIAVLIFLVLKTKVQAFLALIICTVIAGVVGGMPLLTQRLKWMALRRRLVLSIRLHQDLVEHLEVSVLSSVSVL